MLDIQFTYADLEYLLLIFTRVSGVIFIVPFFSMNHVPRRFRAILSVAIAIVLYGVLPRTVLDYSTVTEYALLVAKELICGLLLGMGVNLCTAILSLTGAVVDMEVGFSMVMLMDPATNTQTTITSTLYQYLVMLLLIISGMYQYIIGALSESYQLIGVNGAILSGGKVLDVMVRFMGEYISIGFRICLPVFACILMLNVILGIMTKVSPQLNMFAVGIQLKVLVGLVVIYLTVSLLPIASELIFTEAKRFTVQFVESMM